MSKEEKKDKAVSIGPIGIFDVETMITKVTPIDLKTMLDNRIRTVKDTFDDTYKEKQEKLINEIKETIKWLQDQLELLEKLEVKK